MLGISKWGNKYLCKLLVHGARAALPSLSVSPTRLGKWLHSLSQRAHKNTVIVALANRLAMNANSIAFICRPSECITQPRRRGRLAC